jgi:hypothetical protein
MGGSFLRIHFFFTITMTDLPPEFLASLSAEQLEALRSVSFHFLLLKENR